MPTKPRTGLVYTIRERGRVVFSCPLQCVRCSGHNRDGKRCARRSCVGTPFCWTHTQQLVGVRAKDYPGMGRGLMAIRKGRLPVGWSLAAARTARPIVFKKGEFMMPYLGERLSKEEYERRYVAGNEDSAAEYVIVDGADRYIDGACHRRLPVLINTAVSKVARRAPQMPPVGTNPIAYLSSIMAGTNAQFAVRRGTHDWHGVAVPAASAWIKATKPIREGDQILAYYGDDYRVYVTPGFQESTTKRARIAAPQSKKQKR
jgi:hypothetical protein